MCYDRSVRETNPIPSIAAGAKNLAATVGGINATPAVNDSARDRRATGVQSARDCGDCRVCCTLFEIPEVKKSLNEPCRHQGASDGSGCKIYAHRPEVCRKFDCAWKLGLAGDFDRPDRLGVMFYTVDLEDGLPGLAIVESTPGAFERPRVRDMIALYQSRKPGRIILRRAEDRRFKQASVLIEGKPLAQAVTVRVTTAQTV